MLLIALLLALPVAMLGGLTFGCVNNSDGWGALRLIGYLFATSVITVMAFDAGVGAYDRQTEPCNGDCDVGGLEGIFYGFIAVVACLGAALAAEVVVWAIRRVRPPSRHHSGPAAL